MTAKRFRYFRAARGGGLNEVAGFVDGRVLGHHDRLPASPLLYQAGDARRAYSLGSLRPVERAARDREAVPSMDAKLAPYARDPKALATARQVARYWATRPSAFRDQSLQSWLDDEPALQGKAVRS